VRSSTEIVRVGAVRLKFGRSGAIAKASATKACGAIGVCLFGFGLRLWSGQRAIVEFDSENRERVHRGTARNFDALPGSEANQNFLFSFERQDKSLYLRNPFLPTGKTHCLFAVQRRQFLCGLCDQ
jgi:hypothetical protein